MLAASGMGTLNAHNWVGIHCTRMQKGIKAAPATSPIPTPAKPSAGWHVRSQLRRPRGGPRPDWGGPDWPCIAQATEQCPRAHCWRPPGSGWAFPQAPDRGEVSPHLATGLQIYDLPKFDNTQFNKIWEVRSVTKKM